MSDYKQYLFERTLTNQNSILTLKCEPLYSTPVEIIGFQADNRTTMDALTLSETMDGVDGFLVGGSIFSSTTFHIYLTPASPSIDIMRRCIDQQIGKGRSIDTLLFEFSQTYPATKRHSTFAGYIISGSGVSGGGKLLAGEEYTFRVTPAVEVSF